MTLKRCGRCALQAAMGSCPVYRTQMPEDQQACPNFKMNLENCDICGNLILKNPVVDEDETGIHLICGDCLERPKCHSCETNTYCSFHQNKECKLPPVIVKVVHPQPNMSVQQQVINPDRIAETCAKECQCYYEAGLKDGAHCLRQTVGCCDKYKTKWRG